ncbi:diacylglycerol/lipid kinase family protein [Pseudalkalibacillus caeni]|nr:diacylglycerol kinase family protein [Pseudalkalibacillus caeni]
MNIKKFYFIVNKSAGNGKAGSFWYRLRKRLDERGINYIAVDTHCPGHAEKLAIDICRTEKNDEIALVAVGGDGTIHEVINGLSDFPGVPVGFLPAGSGNDFARGFTHESDPLMALDKILSTINLATYDMGAYRLAESVGLRTFASTFGIGFDAEVSRVTNESSYKRWLNKIKLGRVAYIVSVVRLVFSYVPQDIELVVDERKMSFNRTWLVAVSNIPFMGGGMMVNPSARPNDGLLDVCVVHNMNRFKLLVLFPLIYGGKHIRYKEVKILRGEKITVTSRHPITAHADGEIVGSTPVSITVQPGIRKVI